MERQKFEDSFSEAFHKAEVSPSENVWTNIELDLERLESGKMKRRILFYKLVAAASIAFAMAIGGVGYYVISTEESIDSNLASTEKKINSLPSSPELSASEIESGEGSNSLTTGHIEDAQSTVSIEKSSVNEGLGANKNSIDSNSSRKHEGGNEASDNYQFDLHKQLSLSTSNEEMVTGNIQISSGSLFAGEVRESAYAQRKLPAIVRPRRFELYFPKTEPDEFDLLLAREEWKEKQSNKSSYEKLWTSVGFSTGSFSGGSSGSSASVLSMTNAGFQTYSASNTLSNEASASGIAYSIGVNVGTRLSKRWILQGGLNYLMQNSNYTSDALITSDNQNYSVANSTELAKLADPNSSARIVNTSPYNVNNSLQFLSVPVQAGYVLLNRAFAIQLNGGVSTDLFLQNTITPEKGSLEKVSTGRGDDSPYRPVNFSGLMGTEFSYRFADRYRLALTPGIRYPFNSIYKSETGLQANPVTFDVGLRFRYIFQ